MHRLLTALALAGLGAAPLTAQQAITTTRIGPAATLIASPPDGNIVIVRGEDAILVVDAGAPGIAGRADSAILAAAGAPPRWVVNTHYHADHIGANDRLAAAGATLIGHANLPALAARDTTIAALDWDLDPADPADVPGTLVDDTRRLDLGGETALIEHTPHAHTAGDLIVRFEHANLVHTGDIVEFGAYPFIDWWAGGSFDGLLRAVDHILAGSNDHTVVVPGHGPVLARADVVEFRSMLATVGAHVRAAIAEGRTADEIVESRPTAPWDDRHGGARHGERFVRLLHLEFTRGTE